MLSEVLKRDDVRVLSRQRDPALWLFQPDASVLGHRRNSLLRAAYGLGLVYWDEEQERYAAVTGAAAAAQGGSSDGTTVGELVENRR